MPSITPITVLKNDGVTNVIYSAVTGASGDTPAQWFAPTLGATAATRPELRFHSKKINGKPSMTRVIATVMMPFSVVNSTTGLTSIEKRMIGRLELPFDADIPSSVQDEFISQAVNLFASAHAKAQFKEGAAST